jgi:predicted enzyme related to lactoylglutathione lyase
MDLLANIDVDDLERAITFYRDGIGLTLARRLFDGGVAEMAGASSRVYLLTKPPGGSASAAAALPRDYGRHWTPVHLEFVVDDVEAAVTRAVGAGASLEIAIRDEVWGRIAVLADPFGHGFCLIQFVGRGYGEVQTGE